MLVAGLYTNHSHSMHGRTLPLRIAWKPCWGVSFLENIHSFTFCKLVSSQSPWSQRVVCVSATHTVDAKTTTPIPLA